MHPEDAYFCLRRVFICNSQNGESLNFGSFNFLFFLLQTLLPLANIPLLDYTLQFLVESGIQEIYVYCCAHADQIKAHLRYSRSHSSLDFWL